MLEKIRKRANHLADLFADFLDSYGLNSSDFNIDTVILFELCNRYYRDMDRIHNAHGITNTDSYKIAGYTTYWLSKLKPISVVNKQFYNTNSRFGIYINELFAIYVSTGRMVADLSDKNLTIDLSILGTLLYTLRFRATSGDNLALMYQLIAQTSKCS